MKWLIREGKRKCNECRQVFDLEFFYKNKANRDGLGRRCKPCSKKNSKKWVHGHREYYSKFRNTPSGRLGKYKNGARKRKIEFALSKEEFMSFWQKPCFYCASEMKGVGLDRVDNSRGYNVGNVVSCCSTCNTMKLDFTREEFIQNCKRIAERF